MSSHKDRKHVRFIDDRAEPVHPPMEIEPTVTPVSPSIRFPPHLSKVNYFSLESFESGVEDKITHNAYYEAMIENQYLFEGKTVLHLTDGINLLYSIFAMRSGAQLVYCVINGQSEREVQNIYMMNEIIKENEFDRYIKVMSWNQFNAEVDIIVAEPMGYCMHFDGLLDRMIEARDRFLVKNGKMFPNSLTYKCAMLHDQHFYDHKIEYWNNIYGIPMTSMKKWISHEPMIRIVDPTLIVSKVSKIFTFNLQTISYEEAVKIDRVFELEILGKSKGNGIVFWFEVFFQHGIEKRDIKASPWGDSTKFTQTTLYWPLVMSYNGGKVRVRVKGQKHPKQGYSVISTEVDDKMYQYSFS